MIGSEAMSRADFGVENKAHATQYTQDQIHAAHSFPRPLARLCMTDSDDSFSEPAQENDQDDYVPTKSA